MHLNFALQVQDQGCGIPEDKIDAIFMNFGNLAEHRDANPSGRGLGLSICKSIVQNMGGRIFVESKVGEGSIFNLIFDTKSYINQELLEYESLPKNSSMCSLPWSI